MSKYIYTDGAKAVTLTGDEGWTIFSQYARTTEVEQYAKVAAAFRAYNLIANTVGNMPFALYKGAEEFDVSSKWQNKVGFLPNPQELFRLNTLSLIATNTAYNLRTSDGLGYKTKNLVHAVAYAFTLNTSPVTGELLNITRKVGTQIETYQPEDKRLVRLWRLDHTTEFLPSRNTEAQAIMMAAGQVYHADQWIQHFYARGGIPPTLIAMKGLIMGDAKEDAEKSWSDWLKGLGRWTQKIARIFNAEAMDVKQMGSSVTDLKNNEVYRQALENIAIGLGIPKTRLLSDAANYATADQDYRAWFSDDIIPRCNWLAYEYNRQVFQPLGLRLEFKPETLDPEQEDETSRAQAVSSFIDFLNKCPSAEIALETAATFGYELTDGLVKAITKYFQDKEVNKEVIEKQMEKEPEMEQEEDEPQEIDTKWTPTLDELEEMRVWREVAQRRYKKGESLDFVYQSHYGGLPAYVHNEIITQLPNANSVEEIKSVFDVSKYYETITKESKYDSRYTDDIKLLADAINRLANLEVKEDKPNQTQVNVTLPQITLTAQMPEQGSVVVNVPEQPAPNVTVNNQIPEQSPPVINVEPQIKNDITVLPSDVNISSPKGAKVVRDREGRIKGIEAQ